MKPEVHLFIIWEKGRIKQNEILEDIKNSFDIIKIYEIKWDDKLFSMNLSRFYGTNLPDNSAKEKHCGKGDFLLIIVKDKNPQYEDRETSRGKELVNINMFDKKTLYREMTGGGHKIHATNNEIETNHDLTLLLDKNIIDYLQSIENNPWDGKIERINKNLFGTSNWGQIGDMFYALNNCTKYAILRNYEELPEELYVNEHNDVDIICKSSEDVAFILNAKPVFKEKYRVHYKTKAENKEVFFDLRYINDNYYCNLMEERILNNRIYNEKGFYTLNKEDYFYTLLYHALIQKLDLQDDYRHRLIKLDPEERLDENSKLEDFIVILNKWMKKNNYILTRPFDRSVVFNLNIARFFEKPIYREELEEQYVLNEHIKGDKKIMDIEGNILKWYPFQKDSSVLEIYNEKCILKKINKEINLEECNINDFKIDKKYDYITLIGTFEYASKVFKKGNAYIAFLKLLKEHLNDKGKILLAIDNRLGIKYFVGAKNQNYDRIFEGLGNCVRRNNSNLLLKIEIEKFIKEAGFENYKFYYPLPDYNFVSTIFSDAYLPKSNNSKLIYPLNYDEESIVLYNEINVIKQICDMGQFTNFTNSFFVEIGKNELNNDIRFVHYNIFRKNKYKLMLLMKEKSVEKNVDKDESKHHLENINNNIIKLNELGFNVVERIEDSKIISDFIEGEELDKIIIKKIKNGLIQDAYDEIDKCFKYISSRLNKIVTNQQFTIFEKYNIEIPEEIKGKLTFVEDGFIDLSFDNVFYLNDYVFYDQEWCFKNVPIEFILYRALNNLYTYNDNELKEIISKSELFEKYNLSEYINYFKKLEEVIQTEILDKDKIKEYQSDIEAKKGDIQEIRSAEIYRKREQEKNEELLETIEQFKILKKQKEDIEEKYNLLLGEYSNSRGWKLIRGFRKIIGKDKNEPKIFN